MAVHYGDDLVGTCSFDLTKYIDKGGKNEKVSMIAASSSNAAEESKKQFVLKGNSEEHPDAYLIFRIFVDSIANTTPPAKSKKPKK